MAKSLSMHFQLLLLIAKYWQVFSTLDSMCARFHSFSSAHCWFTNESILNTCKTLPTQSNKTYAEDVVAHGTTVHEVATHAPHHRHGMLAVPLPCTCPWHYTPAHNQSFVQMARRTWKGRGTHGLARRVTQTKRRRRRSSARRRGGQPPTTHTTPQLSTSTSTHYTYSIGVHGATNEPSHLHSVYHC